MKKNLLHIGILLLTLFSCKKDADLTEIIPYQFSPTSVEVALQSVTLKANIQTSQSIQEKGFILERTYKSDFNYDNSSLDTIVIAADAPFECTITSDMEKDQPCTAFAYVKQNGHYYRNEEVTFMPTGCMPPSITSVTFDYNQEYGNYIIIKGENFSKLKERNIIGCYKNGLDAYPQFHIRKVSSTEIICSHQIERTGNAEIKVQVCGLQTSFPCILPGPVVTSWKPEIPRYGETVTLKLSDFYKSMNVYYMSESTDVIHEITPKIHVEDGLISFPFLSNLENSRFTIFTNNPIYWIDTDYIQASIPWIKKQEKKINNSSFCYLNGKLYIDEYYPNEQNQYKLHCYDFQNQNWTSYHYDDINVYSGNYSYMWHDNAYIYLLHYHENTWNPQDIKSFIRFNTLNHEWEVLPNHPIAERPIGLIQTNENVYVYLPNGCYHYSITKNIWNRIEGEITPNITCIAGNHEGYTYYVNDTGRGDIYRIKTGETGRSEFVETLSDEWTDNICSAQIINQNLYLASKNTGIIRYNLHNKNKDYLGIPQISSHHYYWQQYFFIEEGNNLYTFSLCDNSLYQYVEDRND